MKPCSVCGSTICDGDGDFRYFSDEGSQMKVCAPCYVVLRRRDYASGETMDDGS